MKLQIETQNEEITDAARARIAMIVPILKGLLFALKGDRVERLGGHQKVTLYDLAREYREGTGDCGICFEYAVHDALRHKDPRIWPIISEVLEDHCNIKGGAESILFGAEKSGAVSLIETSDKLVTADSRILAGRIGQPAKLKKNWDKIKKALHSEKARDTLPESIKGIWKSDLFIGNQATERWVGTTLKINPKQFEGAAGLRVGIYPEEKKGDRPHIDSDKNLLLCPLPYNSSFMELFYSSFFILKQFLAADALMPKPVALPVSSDRHVALLLEQRRRFTLLDVIEVLSPLAQPNLLLSRTIASDANAPVTAIAPVPRIEN